MRNKEIESTTPLYTLSTISDLSGIPAYSIRQYIDKGLIIPYRKESNRNLFSQVDVLRLKYIFKLLNDGGFNIAAIKAILALIPCWAIRKCPAKDHKNCKACLSTTYPCWEASEKGLTCKNNNCRECEVYTVVENYPDLKAFIRSIIK